MRHQLAVNLGFMLQVFPDFSVMIFIYIHLPISCRLWITALSAGNVFGEMFIFPAVVTCNTTVVATGGVVLRRLFRESLRVVEYYENFEENRPKTQGQ